jgi:hypothetical protein
VNNPLVASLASAVFPHAKTIRLPRENAGLLGFLTAYNNTALITY